VVGAKVGAGVGDAVGQLEQEFWQAAETSSPHHFPIRLAGLFKVSHAQLRMVVPPLYDPNVKSGSSSQANTAGTEIRAKRIILIEPNIILTLHF